MTLMPTEGQPDTLAGAGDDPTMVVPDATRTEAAEFAWSHEDADTEQLGSHRWREAWSAASALMFLAALVAFAVAGFGWFTLHHHDTPAAAAPSSAAPAPDVVVQPGPWTPPVTPRDAQHLPTGAALFNVLLARAGIHSLDPSTADAAANTYGQGVCAQLAQGYTVQDEVNAMEGVRMGDGRVPTAAQAWAIVRAAEQVYCP